MMVYIDGNAVITVVLIAFAILFTWIFMSFREPHIHAAGWNNGYERGIEQGLAEAAEKHGGPPAPLRIEETVR